MESNICGKKLKCLSIHGNIYSCDYGSVFTLKCPKGHIAIPSKRLRKCKEQIK